MRERKRNQGKRFTAGYAESVEMGMNTGKEIFSQRRKSREDKNVFSMMERNRIRSSKNRYKF